MEKLVKYKTKQRARILNYLKQNRKIHITAEELLNHFKQIGQPIGKSTVYRYLDSLVSENIIRKYVTSERASACFQYIDNMQKCNNHYHMKCLICGELYHIDCEAIEELKEHIVKSHNFIIDTSKTVLYGKCNKCFK